MKKKKKKKFKEAIYKSPGVSWSYIARVLSVPALGYPVSLVFKTLGLRPEVLRTRAIS